MTNKQLIEVLINAQYYIYLSQVRTILRVTNNIEQAMKFAEKNDVSKDIKRAIVHLELKEEISKNKTGK